MILLESANKAIHDFILERLASAEKPTHVEFKLADFDGTMWRVSTPTDNKGVLQISISSGASAALKENGGIDKLKSAYGASVQKEESGFDATIHVDLSNVKDAEKEKIATSAAMLKTHLFTAPLVKMMESAESGGNIAGLVDIPLRGSEERMWIKQDGKERITVLFSVNFVDADDIVFGKVFLQEFKKSIAGAPAVDFVYKNPPLELKSVKNMPRSENIGYVTFVVFDRHFKDDKKVKTAQTLITFRNYLHYHIKCAKSHLHTRMRNRVESLLKILNRAKQELDEDKEKKTATGRTFTRKE
jgi:actin related protein 2/3 complex subunit 2